MINRIFAGLGFILERIFGKKNIESLRGRIQSYQQRVADNFAKNFDTSGRFYPVIAQMYRWAARLVLLAVGYYFMVQTNFLWLTGRMPSVDELQNPKLSQSSIILSMDGEILGDFYAENRVPVDSSQISPWVFKALIATEDARYFQHSGIDLRSLGGVAYGILTGGDRGGGSTITQQLAKNLYNTRQKEMRGLLYSIPGISTLVYKSKEWFTAIALERRYTKGEIATMYLNTVDFGSNAYGIKTAAHKYFSKEPIDLLPEEAAVLIGILKATTFYNPIRNPENSLRRRNTVLNLMGIHGYLTPEAAGKLTKLPLALNVEEDKSAGSYENYFKGEIARIVNDWAKHAERDIDLNRDGLKIYTTIDARMQDYAVGAMTKHMKTLQREFNSEWGTQNPWRYMNGEEIENYIDTVAKRTTYYRKLADKYKDNQDSIDKYMNLPMPMKLFSYDGIFNDTISHMDSIRYYKKFLQSGMMAMDPYNGYIKAWVGGIDFEHFQYDHVKQGKRQPGSAFKPILYTAAIDGPADLSPCDRRRDDPQEYKVGEGKVWKPRNANGRFTYSNMTLRTAMARSVNSVAVKLAMEIGPNTVAEYARKLGITSPLDVNGSIALGTSDVSLYELVGAYAPFVNRGRYTKPILVYRIEDSKGKILAEFQPKSEEAIREESAFLMQYMLRGNVEEGGGTGRRMLGYNAIFQNHGQLGGKTGTTSNNSDAWYLCITKDLVCGSWVGGDDRSIHFRSTMGEGSKSALPIVGLFLEKVYSDKNLSYRPGPFPKPPNTIEKKFQNCFSSNSPVYSDDDFIDSLGVQPIDTVRRIIIDTANGERGLRKISKRRNPRVDSVGDLRRKIEIKPVDND